MGEGVIADLVSLAQDAAEQRGVQLGILADDEERRRRVARVERVEDHRRPRAVWPVVEREGHGVLAAAVPLDDVGRGRGEHGVHDDLPSGRVDPRSAAPQRRLRHHTEDLPGPDELHVVANPDCVQRLRAGM